GDLKKEIESLQSRLASANATIEAQKNIIEATTRNSGSSTQSENVKLEQDIFATLTDLKAWADNPNFEDLLEYYSVGKECGVEEDELKYVRAAREVFGELGLHHSNFPKYDPRVHGENQEAFIWKEFIRRATKVVNWINKDSCETVTSQLNELNNKFNNLKSGLDALPGVLGSNDELVTEEVEKYKNAWEAEQNRPQEGLLSGKNIVIGCLAKARLLLTTKKILWNMSSKIIDYLTEIATICAHRQLNNEKITFLLARKKEYEEAKAIAKEYQELLNQAISYEEKSLLKEGTGQNVLVEIRPGTGGTEAGLFVRDLYRMYYKLAEKMNWKVEMVETKVDVAGNFDFVAFLVKGPEVFAWLKNEAGVHRVQRVPVTESKGRVHTSTASVVILPEATDISVNIHPQNLKTETYRSSGAGGQHVNTTDSAVKLTYTCLINGKNETITATSQDGRSQHDNKKRALFVLKSRLLEKLRSEQAKQVGNLRSSMIGTAERAEKIRTYN
ncbi:1190_t:CDS:2, partial [Racocetra persica]